MSLKDNWDKTPEIEHSTIIKTLILVWCAIVAWTLILGVSPAIILAVPAPALALLYVLVRLAP